jgi:hypothetical protein
MGGSDVLQDHAQNNFRKQTATFKISHTRMLRWRSTQVHHPSSSKNKTRRDEETVKRKLVHFVVKLEER